MAKKFCDALSKPATDLPPLPLVHTTSSPTFEFFLADAPRRLEARICKVYNEPLLYETVVSTARR